MTMLEICKKELDTHNALTPSLNGHVKQIVTAISVL